MRANYIYYAKKIKISESILGEVEVYVFGSVVNGEYTLSSDIDILIVSKNAPFRQYEKAKIVDEVF